MFPTLSLLRGNKQSLVDQYKKDNPKQSIYSWVFVWESINNNEANYLSRVRVPRNVLSDSAGLQDGKILPYSDVSPHLFLPLPNNLERQCPSHPIQIIHESIFLSLPAIALVLYINYHRDVNKATYLDIAKHRFIIILAVVEPLLLTRIPYYSLAILAGSILIVSFIIQSLVKQALKQWTDFFFTVMIPPVISIVSLIDEGYLGLNIKIVLILPSIFVLINGVIVHSFILKHLK
jgi:hypothetical protein